MPKTVLKPCTENAIQIGQAIQAVEALSRTPASPSQAQQIADIYQYMASLQKEYSENCLGKG
ncbi:MAG: hypothetical protein ABSC15_13320 [Terriglobales bacterium]|jgi:hypothetical protein